MTNTKFFYTSCSLVALFFMLFISAKAQQGFPGNHFCSPLDIRHFITGTFGEVRPDHLHSGVDFDTDEKAGSNVYAIDDGYVSRIKVSAGGYGKVLYITHPHGLVSVYAHLDEFNVVVEDYVTRKQYEKESFEIELFPHPVLFKVKKGDIIGYSGNTGSSTGPHLHFEIRHERSEMPVNPALLGIYAADALDPVIYALRVYPGSNGDSVKGKETFAEYTFKRTGDTKKYTITDTVGVTGSCYFGIMTADFVSGNNSTGPYSVNLFIDSVPAFSFRLDSFAFSESRYVNDMIDYADWVNSRERYLLLRTSPGNKLSVYKNIKNRGILTCTKQEMHHIRITVRDFVQNECSLEFMVAGKPHNIVFSSKPLPEEYPVFKYDSSNHFKTNDVTLDFPAFSFYDSFQFEYEKLENTANHFSARHRVGSRNIPLHKAFDISIRTDSVPAILKSKTVIARGNASGNWVSIGGVVQNDYISSSSLQFGDFIIVIDTASPEINPVNFREKKKIGGTENLFVKAKDDFSGIGDYRAEVDGHWLLMEYDAKNDLFIIPVSDKIPVRNFVLSVKIKDKCGNERKVDYLLDR